MKDWRDSSGLLGRLLTGNPLRDNGTGIVPQPDPVHVVDYMQVPNPGDGNFKNYVAPNLTTGMSMQAGDGKYGQEAVDMTAANDWSDLDASRGTDLSYGQSHTDSERDRTRGGY